MVPRTFLGPLLLSALALPGALTVWLLVLPKPVVQLIVRLCLAAVVWRGFHAFHAAVCSQFSQLHGKALLVIVSVQFHFLFYSSRTLPNTFAVAAGDPCFLLPRLSSMLPHAVFIV